jgi:hypothetical protein
MKIKRRYCSRFEIDLCAATFCRSFSVLYMLDSVNIKTRVTTSILIIVTSGLNPAVYLYFQTGLCGVTKCCTESGSKGL